MPRVSRAPRNSVSDRPSGWRLALRRQRYLLRPLLLVSFGSVAVATLVVVAGKSAGVHIGPGSSLTSVRERFGELTAGAGLRVNKVAIDGRFNTPEALLRAAIGVSKGDPILGFSLEETKARIEMIPWVEHATVERRLPGTVLVSLRERSPIAIWQNQGKYVLVDRYGQVVANQEVAEFSHRLPLVVGQGAPAAAAALLDALRDRPSLLEKVSASVRVGERRWNLRMTNGTDILLPEAHEVAALDRLIQLQQEHAVLDRPLAAIDLRLPDRLVFRPKNESRDGAAMPAAPPVAAKKPT